MDSFSDVGLQKVDAISYHLQNNSKRAEDFESQNFA